MSSGVGSLPQPSLPNHRFRSLVLGWDSIIVKLRNENERAKGGTYRSRLRLVIFHSIPFIRASIIHYPHSFGNSDA